MPDGCCAVVLPPDAVPHLRGYGSTRFLSEETPRNGQQAVLAVDAVALLDALEIGSAIVAGFDWEARTANVMAALAKMRRERRTTTILITPHLDRDRRAL